MGRKGPTGDDQHTQWVISDGPHMLYTRELAGGPGYLRSIVHKGTASSLGEARGPSCSSLPMLWLGTVNILAVLSLLLSKYTEYLQTLMERHILLPVSLFVDKRNSEQHLPTSGLALLLGLTSGPNIRPNTNIRQRCCSTVLPPS